MTIDSLGSIPKLGKIGGLDELQPAPSGQGEKIGSAFSGALKDAMLRAAEKEKPGGPAVAGGYVPPPGEAAKDAKEKGYPSPYDK